MNSSQSKMDPTYELFCALLCIRLKFHGLYLTHQATIDRVLQKGFGLFFGKEIKSYDHAYLGEVNEWGNQRIQLDGPDKDRAFMYFNTGTN